MPHRIMLVEDDAGVRSRLAGALAASGFETTLADDESATVLFETERADLLVLDLDLESGHAWDVFADLRSREGRLCAITLTGAPSRADIARLLRADAVLQKPVDPDAVLRAAREVLKAEADRTL